MTKLTHKNKIKIEPSSRDSISSWLDVLTSMLAVPDAQRDQVRDELEDHLRSRVDDLLIVGKPEPEAIQIAVAELGETAELAKLITHAHTRTNPRRKIMNTALIAVALGGMSFGGFTFFNSPATPSATPSNGGAVPVVVPAETRRDDGKKYAFNLEEVPDLQAVEAIAEAFGLEVTVSDGLKAYYRKAGFPHEFTLQGEYTLEQAVKVLEWSDLKRLNSRVVRYTDQKLQLMTGDEYARQQIQTRVYDPPKWIARTESDLFSYAQSLKSLLKVKYDLDYTSIQTIGGSMVVAAPPEIHTEIVKFMTDLEAILTQQRAERMREIEKESAKVREETARREAEIKASSERNALEIKRKQEQSAIERKAYQEQQRIESRRIEAEKQAARKQVIERAQAEFNAVRKGLLDTKAKINMVVSEIKKLQNKSAEASSKRALDPDIPIDEERQAQITDLTNTLTLLDFEHDEVEERYMYLRTRLLDSQYANLFEGLE
jgi:hypothetical protein